MCYALNFISFIYFSGGSSQILLQGISDSLLQGQNKQFKIRCNIESEKVKCVPDGVVVGDTAADTKSGDFKCRKRRGLYRHKLLVSYLFKCF